MFILCNDASMVMKSTVLKIFEKKGGNPDF